MCAEEIPPLAGRVNEESLSTKIKLPTQISWGSEDTTHDVEKIFDVIDLIINIELKTKFYCKLER